MRDYPFADWIPISLGVGYQFEHYMGFSRN